MLSSPSRAKLSSMRNWLAVSLLLLPLAARCEPAFYASDFLNVDPNAPKPAVSSLTFQSLSTAPEDLDQRLDGVFKISYACAGRPLPARLVVLMGGYDGYAHAGLLSRFEQGQLVETLLVPPSSDLGAFKTLRYPESCARALSQEGGVAVASYVCAPNGRKDSSGTLKLTIQRVAETGEIVLLDDSLDALGKETGICPEQLRAVLSAIPTQ